MSAEVTPEQMADLPSGRLVPNVSNFELLIVEVNHLKAERDAALRDVAILRPAAAHAERAEAELRALREGVEEFLAMPTMTPGQCCTGDCVGVGSAVDGLHDLRPDQSYRLREILRALLSDGPSA